jgi:hypothetical protein
VDTLTLTPVVYSQHCGKKYELHYAAIKVTL